MAHTDELFTIEEAASYLGLGTSRLYQLRGAGEGPVSWRLGKRLVYPRSGLDAYRADQRQRTMRGRGVVTA
ncbi:helix-turn-helix domain-containing protein [Mycobacterium hodleri]|uniref:helix-turn-helix transcriptional regulator n=1 Tax=Mycolicibacterium hodleri TaxID=49897 RepID=UPI0021F2F971|nr:helix-turn-helix domain-containing protein [Mycolicibacterium hodleri]MCV7132514.1 helix-turn-helix domain-containing protein [Mycolicibacterium hodleri]